MARIALARIGGLHHGVHVGVLQRLDAPGHRGAADGACRLLLTGPRAGGLAHRRPFPGRVTEGGRIVRIVAVAADFAGVCGVAACGAGRRGHGRVIVVARLCRLAGLFRAAVLADPGLLARFGTGRLLRQGPGPEGMGLPDRDAEFACGIAQEAGHKMIGRARGHPSADQEIEIRAAVVIVHQQGPVLVVKGAVGIVAAAGRHRVGVRDLRRKDVVFPFAAGLDRDGRLLVQQQHRPQIQPAAGAESAGHVVAQRRDRLRFGLAAAGAGPALFACLGTGRRHCIGPCAVAVSQRLDRLCLFQGAVSAGARPDARLRAGGLCRHGPVAEAVLPLYAHLEFAGRTRRVEADSNGIGLPRGQPLADPEVSAGSVVVRRELSAVFIVKIPVGIAIAGGLDDIDVCGLGFKAVVYIPACCLDGTGGLPVQSERNPEVKAAAGADAVAHIMSQGRDRFRLFLAADRTPVDDGAVFRTGCGVLRLNVGMQSVPAVSCQERVSVLLGKALGGGVGISADRRHSRISQCIALPVDIAVRIHDNNRFQSRAAAERAAADVLHPRGDDGLRQTGAVLKRRASDGCHRLGHRDVRQTAAAPERICSDLRHAVRDLIRAGLAGRIEYEARHILAEQHAVRAAVNGTARIRMVGQKAFAACERIFPDACQTRRQDDFSQRGAVLEGIVFYARHRIRDPHFRQVLTAVERPAADGRQPLRKRDRSDRLLMIVPGNVGKIFKELHVAAAGDGQRPRALVKAPMQAIVKIAGHWDLLRAEQDLKSAAEIITFIEDRIVVGVPGFQIGMQQEIVILSAASVLRDHTARTVIQIDGGIVVSERCQAVRACRIGGKSEPGHPDVHRDRRPCPDVRHQCLHCIRIEDIAAVFAIILAVPKLARSILVGMGKLGADREAACGIVAVESRGNDISLAGIQDPAELEIVAGAVVVVTVEQAAVRVIQIPKAILRPEGIEQIPVCSVSREAEIDISARGVDHHRNLRARRQDDPLVIAAAGAAPELHAVARRFGSLLLLRAAQRASAGNDAGLDAGGSVALEHIVVNPILAAVLPERIAVALGILLRRGAGITVNRHRIGISEQRFRAVIEPTLRVQHRHGAQRAAAGKHVIIDAANMFRNRHGSQAGTALKRPAVDLSQTVREGHGAQAGTARKRGASQIGRAIRDPVCAGSPFRIDEQLLGVFTEQHAVKAAVGFIVRVHRDRLQGCTLSEG